MRSIVRHYNPDNWRKILFFGKSINLKWCFLSTEVTSIQYLRISFATRTVPKHGPAFVRLPRGMYLYSYARFATQSPSVTSKKPNQDPNSHTRRNWRLFQRSCVHVISQYWKQQISNWSRLYLVHWLLEVKLLESLKLGTVFYAQFWKSFCPLVLRYKTFVTLSFQNQIYLVL